MPECPHCRHPLTEVEIKTAWASLTQSKRITKTGGRNGGRPPEKDRCPCGLYSVKTAEARRHKCEAVAARKDKREDNDERKRTTR